MHQHRDRAMSVHGGVVGSAETILEECRRLFGLRTRSLQLQPHARIADYDLIEMPRFRHTFSLTAMKTDLSAAERNVKSQA